MGPHADAPRMEYISSVSTYDLPQERVNACDHLRFTRVEPSRLQIWKRARIYDALVEVQSRDCEDAYILVKLGIEWDDPFLLSKAVPFVSGNLKDAKFLVDTLECFYQHPEDFGNDKMIACCKDILLAATAWGPVVFGSNVRPDTFLTLRHLGEASQLALRLLLVKLMAYGVKKSIYVCWFVEKVWDSKPWKEESVLDALSHNVLGPAISTIEYSVNRIDPEDGLTAGELKRLIYFLYKMGLPRHVSDLVTRLATYPSLDPDEFEKALGPKRYKDLCQLQAKNFPAWEEDHVI